MRLAGEHALVTGSTAGIGAVIATRFGAEGAAVAVTGRDRDRGEAVVAAIAATGGTALFLAAELADEAACARLVDDTTERLGGLTVLVNNAARVGGGDGPVGALSTSAWEATLRVDLTAPMWLCRQAIPQMTTAGHGSIINISTRQAERASPGFAAYIAAKGALNALTRSIAVDYAHAGIRCNTLSPGYVLNERRDAGLSAERRARLEAMHLTRLGVASDIAHAAVYLASPESELLTGVTLPIDGGSSIARGATLG